MYFDHGRERGARREKEKGEIDAYVYRKERKSVLDGMYKERVDQETIGRSWEYRKKMKKNI